MRKFITAALAAALIVPLTTACSEQADTPQASPEPAVEAVAEPVAEPQIVRSEGDCQPVFEGQICSFSESRDGELLTFGATVPMSTVENAPPEGEMAFPPVTLARVLMTDEVRQATGIDHLGVNWEIYGHPPKTYMTPHFDFHFYTMTGEDVNAIDCQDTTKPESLPEGYVLPDEYIEEMNVMLVGLCVPEMGMHAVNAEESAREEFFDGTMIVGYIYGNPHFIEPMIAKHHLMKRADFALDVPDMGPRGDGLANPAAFEARYDPERDAYHLTFSLGD